MSAWDDVSDYTDATNGALLLDDVEAFLTRFVAFPSEHTRVAVTLWAAHTHALDAFESTPRLALLSPEPGSGKTRAQEVLELLVPRPLFSMNASAAALFRKVSDPDGRPTVLLDEADTVFGPRAAKEHEDLRGFVNAGHRRGAVATRCVVRGKNVEVEDYPCYAAVSLSGLDDLPDTIMSRAVVVRMRRRAPHEHVEPYRRRLHAGAGEDLRDRLDTWAASVAGELAGFPDMPEGVEDRAADVWEALLAVADVAGGDWPKRARVAAVALVADSRGGAETLGVKLLTDLRAVFADTDRQSTEHILGQLITLDESPWGDLRGKPLDPRGLSRRLGRYEIKPHNIRIGDKIAKGYERGDFVDAWSRYCPVAPEEDGLGGGVTQPSHSDAATASVPQGSATSATSATSVQDYADLVAGLRAIGGDTTIAEARQAGRSLCPHGILNGDQPDDFVGGRLTCTQCRAMAS